MINTIIFDLGNVLLQLNTKRFEKNLRQLHINPQTLEVQNAINAFGCGKLPTTLFFDTLRQIAKQPFITNKQILEAWNSMLESFSAQNILLLQLLNQAGYRIFILSNTNPLHAKALKKLLGAKNYALFIANVEHIYYSHQLKLRKPDAAIYKYLINNAQLNPADTLFIDDNPINTAAAQALGFKTLTYNQTQPLIKLLQAEPYHINILKQYNAYKRMQATYINDHNQVSVLFKCTLPLSFLKVTYNTTRPSVEQLYAPETLEFIENIWVDSLNKSQATNHQLFNGPLAAVQTISIGNQITVNTSAGNYKQFIATRSEQFLPFVQKFNLQPTNPLTISTVFETYDNKIVLGALKGNHAHWVLAGGMCDPSQDLNGTELNVQASAQRELTEELCPLTLNNWQFIGICAHTRAIFTTIVLTCKAAETFTQIQQMHTPEQAPDFKEIPEIIGIEITESNFTQLLQRRTPYTPYGISTAALLLFGRIKFGDAWYHENSHAVANQIA